MSTVVALVGPTASGKSDVALELAARLGGEIVCCDSVQVYRGFSIGSAKPSAAEQERVPHHVLDVAGWDEPFDAQRYSDLARAAITAIQARGRPVFVCGGTGLYLRALRYGLVATPPADPALRHDLMAQERARPGTLYARLTELDTASARRIEPHNLVQIVRALEICQTTGEPASRLRERHGFRDEQVPMRVWVLAWPATALRARIAARSQAMLQQGLVEEVQGLLAQGVPATARPMQAVGYREACAVALGQAPAAGLAERIVRSTWQYARRQRTWFRRETDVAHLPVDDLRRAQTELLRLLA